MNLKCVITQWYGKTLHDNDLDPYHFQRAQELLPADFDPHEQFARWFMNNKTEHNDLTKYVLSLKKLLLCAVVCLIRTTYTCGRMKTPHVVHQSRHQHW